MSVSANLRQLADEHRALVGRLGRIQRRCSELVAAPAAEIEQLRGEVMRLRAQVIIRDTALAGARADLAALEASVPGLPRRVTLARMVEALKARVQELMRERLSGIGFAPSAPPVVSAMLADLREKAVLYVGRDESGASFAKRLVEMAGGRFTHHPAADTDDHAALEASLIATDLVICQSGCVSHNAYWRVQDHCRRTGKQCVLVRQPRPVEFLPRRSAVTRTDRNDGSSDD